MTNILKLPRDELEAMATAGEEVANCIRVLGKSGAALSSFVVVVMSVLRPEFEVNRCANTTKPPMK